MAYNGEEARNKSYTDIIQRCQNKVLRNIADAPWYVRNGDLRRDLQMKIVTNEIGRFAKKHWRKASPPQRRRSDPGARQQRTGAKAYKKERKTFWAGVVVIKTRAQPSAP